MNRTFLQLKTINAIKSTKNKMKSTIAIKTPKV